MRKIILISIFICLLSCRTSQTIAQKDKQAPSVTDNLEETLYNLAEQIINSMAEGDKKKVAVIEFSDLDGQITDFGKYLAEELMTRLFMTKKFEVIERQLLNKVLSEQKLSLTGYLDASAVQKIGKLLGVDAIVSGTITDLGVSLKVNARIVSTETGKVFAVAATEIVKDETVKKLIKSGVKTTDLTEKKNEKQQNEISESSWKSFEEMEILEGRWSRKPNTVIHGTAYPNALFFDDERVFVRLFQRYKRLTMKVGVDDKAGLQGCKRFRIRDHEQNELFTNKAMPNLPPIDVDIDISQAEWIEINAIDYNGQPRAFIRWIDIKFWLK